MTRLPTISGAPFTPDAPDSLRINEPLAADWLISFLRDEIVRRRGFQRAVVGVSGGVDSSLTAFLLAWALGPQNVHAFRMPYRTSSPESLAHAELVAEATGIRLETVDISPAVDGYLQLCPDADGRRRGNVMARMRMIVLFDQSQKLGTLPVGTGNKTERLLGYFTWHADDSPAVNPLGDLYKTQVWALARHVGVPDVIVDKPATADLIVGLTAEGELGISYPQADRILFYLLRGYPTARLVEMGFDEGEVSLVQRRLDSTHWKRHLPTTAMVSSTSINDYYLRPVDY